MSTVRIFHLFVISVSISILQVTAQTSSTVQETYGKDSSTNPSQWQYNPTQAATDAHHKNYEHHYGHVGTRQGALMGSPLYGVFPIIFLIGLAAIIIIPLLFFTFSPYGFGGGFGQGAYAKKRSLLDEWDIPFLRRNLLDLVVTVSDAIEKFGPMMAEPNAKKKGT